MDWSRLEREFGKNLLLYSLNVDAANWDNWRSGVSLPSTMQTKHLSLLEQWLLKQRIESSSPIGREFRLEAVLSADLIRTNNFFNLSRRENCGTLRSRDSSDPVLNLLCKLGEEIFPLVLWRTRDRDFQDGLLSLPFGETLFGHPFLPQLWQEIEASPFKRLFKWQTPPESCAGLVNTSAGQGGTIRLSTWHSRIWASAEMLWRARGCSNEDEFQTAIVEAYEIFKQAAAGNTVQAPLFLGIENVCLNLGAGVKEFSFGHERLFVIPGQLRQYLPHTHRPYPHHDGNSMIEVGCVLETTYPYAIRTGEMSPEDFTPFATQGYAAMEERFDHLRVAALLADSAPYKPLRESWRLLIEPSNGCVFSYSNVRRLAVPLVATPRIARELATNADLLKSVDYQKAKIAVRRLILAAAEREDVTDSFVDAVIAWENLLGGKPETVLRMCTSMAKLLETNSSKREKVLRKLKGQYGARSSIVHGEKVPSPKDLLVLRDEAIRCGLEVFRILLRDKPHLLGISATKRSEAILIE